MPIVTQQFAYVPRPLRDGRLRVREEHITDKGRVYFYPYKFAGTVAEAITARDARDWPLIKDEVVDFEQHILDGNTPNSFTWTDQTQLQGFRRFLRGFLDLLTVTFLIGFGQRPQHMLGAFGLGFFGLGMLGHEPAPQGETC